MAPIQSNARQVPARQSGTDAAIKAAIRGPLMAMTAMHLMSETDAKAVIEFWVNVLRPFTPEQIAEGFTRFAQNGGGRHPNPQLIVAAIKAGGDSLPQDTLTKLREMAQSEVPPIREYAETRLRRLKEEGKI